MRSWRARAESRPTIINAAPPTAAARFPRAIVNEIDANLELLRAGDALAASERGWAMLPRVGDEYLRRQLRRMRAEALAANGRIGEAHAMLDALIGSVDGPEGGELLALARGSQDAIELDADHPEAAAVLARQAVAGLPTPEDYLRRARAARIEVLALHRLGRDADAAASLPPDVACISF